jgi:L-threonylcarbamoyladenylate synthase
MSSSQQLKNAANVIKNGGVISYPSESVYGLGCDPLCETAVKRILKLKNRPIDKGLIIVAGNLKQLSSYIVITAEEIQKILNEKTPTTWLVNKSRLTPAWVSGKHEKVAIRISHHPIIIKLCGELNHPVISTSANPTGSRPALSCQQSLDYFSDRVDIYLDSNFEISGQPTPIRDISSGAIIR